MSRKLQYMDMEAKVHSYDTLVSNKFCSPICSLFSTRNSRLKLLMKWESNIAEGIPCLEGGPLVGLGVLPGDVLLLGDLGLEVLLLLSQHLLHPTQLVDGLARRRGRVLGALRLLPPTQEPRHFSRDGVTNSGGTKMETNKRGRDIRLRVTKTDKSSQGAANAALTKRSRGITS